MKKIISCIFIILTSTVLFSQKMDPKAIGRLSPTDQELVKGYLKQSRNFNVTNIVLASVGGALLIGGLANAFHYELGDGYSDEAALPLMITGTAALLSSIPFFILARVKKQQPRAIVFAEKGVNIAPYKLIPNSGHVGLKLVIPIGK